ncbi:MULTISPECIES: tripartite tricarboxylate transporter permease [unclassified Mesorhizobium]|uniref:tripartite tricarboxylate transporter permease n=1 Tax=unclassified Mesorhizobium TaxID=325217 RepID=UPI00112909A4|nr:MULTISPECIES: tripartite tricarboxylate transporter permease [unclassified Mesorhizobium]MBZ9894361.1 tripartite tricarboxylate transporter permease [Mesorhizobium sp. BR1-1-6]TPM57680.1 tripartite tricarboxylate transporter permease [Mesorhizobium sp. B2-2-4]TPM65517.1 tripartite tricarboxylate transporter permease [Mesorhizobium sp. B2-2-1]TPM98492.1 tripartite tricarboxylate transporter permease [Mesorhizobium sp. B2-1-5]TPN38573.1 tripartite tricarboxylate transporter permease [Mesorhiz
MDLLSHLATGFSVAVTPVNMLFCTIGVIAGTLIGALPGIGPVAGIAMLLPFAYGMEPVTAMILMAGIYSGTMFGGSITSVLVGIPGEASNIPTCLDGYEMAKKGRAGPALTISAIGSFIAGTFSVVMLMLFAPPIARWALSFGPPEYFALMLLGLGAVAGLMGDAKLKGYLMAFLGLTLSLVGFDMITGYQRFTFGSLAMADGIKFLPIAVGLFGIAEVLLTLEQMASYKVIRASLKDMMITPQDIRESAAPIARGTVIGFLVGILPGAGGAVAALLSYVTERKFSKHPERFGTGEIAGVAGPGSADNASTGGSMIPMLTLGIPGSATTAVMLGALTLFNIQPGPFLFASHPEFVWGLIASMYIGNVMLLVLNIAFVPAFVQALRVPFTILGPLIIVFAVVGVYSVSASMFDLWVLLIFSVLGYFMKKFGYPAAPMVLALVLGNGLETALRQSLMMSQGNALIFFDRPISGTLMVVVVLMLALPLLRLLISKARHSVPGPSMTPKA